MALKLDYITVVKAFLKIFNAGFVVKMMQVRAKLTHDISYAVCFICLYLRIHEPFRKHGIAIRILRQKHFVKQHFDTFAFFRRYVNVTVSHPCDVLSSFIR